MWQAAVRERLRAQLMAAGRGKVRRARPGSHGQRAAWQGDARIPSLMVRAAVAELLAARPRGQQRWQKQQAAKRVATTFL